MSKTFEVIFKEFHESETFVVSQTMLEDYKTKAAQEERERIILLLSDSFDWDNSVIVDRDELIALIQGENK